LDPSFSLEEISPSSWRAENVAEAAAGHGQTTGDWSFSIDADPMQQSEKKEM
jgi:hypothetical protein